MNKVVTFPVPRGMTTADALRQIEAFGCFPNYKWWNPRYVFPHHWAVMVVDDDE